MRIASPLRALLGVEHPVLLAPMAGVAGGELAAAVSRAGGLGLIGGGYGDPDWIGAAFDAAGDAPVGIGFITWRLEQNRRALDLALARGPRAVLLSFGDVTPWAAAIQDAGALLLAQVQSVEQGLAAREAGAAAVIAQGGEAGGHAGMRGTLPLVPAIVDALAPLPVIAAGGIGDGRGFAAALMLGASGVMLGSRFYASSESLAHANAKALAVTASGDDTMRSAVFDRLRGYDWPVAYELRALRNRLTRQWQADPGGISRNLAGQRARFDKAVRDGDTDLAPVIVGEAAGLIRDAPRAAEIMARLVDETCASLAGAARLLND